MAHCPACGTSINSWQILALGKSNTIQCPRCSNVLKVPAKISGVKVFTGVGFLMGGLAGGLCAMFGFVLQWIAFILIWILFLCLVDIRYTHLEVKRNGKPAP